jgi:Uma2 family endonuclease
MRGHVFEFGQTASASSACEKSRTAVLDSLGLRRCASRFRRAAMVHLLPMEMCEMTVIAPARPTSGAMDIEEFMAFIAMRPKEERWHLVEGIAVMMAPPSLAHQRIAWNLCELLNRAFVSQRSDLFAYHEIAVRLPGVVNFQPEPDVVVAPGTAGYELFAEDFRLIAEILSPSNTRTEIESKLRRYREAANNLYVLLIEPRAFRVEIHARSRAWQETVLARRGDPIDLPEFGVRCSVEDLYRGTPLVPQYD